MLTTYTHTQRFIYYLYKYNMDLLKKEKKKKRRRRQIKLKKQKQQTDRALRYFRLHYTTSQCLYLLERLWFCLAKRMVCKKQKKKQQQINTHRNIQKQNEQNI